jgi:hypothetical protein
MKAAVMRIARWLFILLAAIGVALPLVRLEFWVAGASSEKWLLNLLIIPGSVLQRWLVERNLAPPPQAGGHMPDLGFTILFDLAVNAVLAFATLHLFEHQYQKWKIRREHR